MMTNWFNLTFVNMVYKYQEQHLLVTGVGLLVLSLSHSHVHSHNSVLNHSVSVVVVETDVKGENPYRTGDNKITFLEILLLFYCGPFFSCTEME